MAYDGNGLAHVLSPGHLGELSEEWSAAREGGGQNHLSLDVFHEVTQIHSPGRTLTLMVCGAGRKGDWGNLNPETGAFEPNRPDPSFRDRLKALNPRMP